MEFVTFKDCVIKGEMVPEISVNPFAVEAIFPVKTRINFRTVESRTQISLKSGTIFSTTDPYEVCVGRIKSIDPKRKSIPEPKTTVSQYRNGKTR